MLLLRSVHQAVHDDNPMIFLWTLDSYAAISTSVQNVNIHPFYFFTWPEIGRISSPAPKLCTTHRTAGRATSGTCSTDTRAHGYCTPCPARCGAG